MLVELLGLEGLWMEEPGMPGIPRRWRRQPGQDRRLEELIQLQPANENQIKKVFFCGEVGEMNIN